MWQAIMLFGARMRLRFSAVTTGIRQKASYYWPILVAKVARTKVAISNWVKYSALPWIQRQSLALKTWWVVTALPFLKRAWNSFSTWSKYKAAPFLKRNGGRLWSWVRTEAWPFVRTHWAWFWLFGSIGAILYTLKSSGINWYTAFWILNIAAAIITIRKEWPIVLSYFKGKGFEILNGVADCYAGKKGETLFMFVWGATLLFLGYKTGGDNGTLIGAIGLFTLVIIPAKHLFGWNIYNDFLKKIFG